MALNCKICNNVVNALSSYRCRKCHMLVCSACLGAEPVEGEGALCKKCFTSVAPAEPASAQTSFLLRFWDSCKQQLAAVFNFIKIKFASLRPRVKFFLFGLFLASLFLFIVYLPLVRAKLLHAKLLASDQKVVSRAHRDLVKIGGKAIIDEMREELVYGNETGRLRALKVLGELGSIEVLSLLRTIVEDEQESEAIREIAREAAIKIETY